MFRRFAVFAALAANLFAATSALAESSRHPAKVPFAVASFAHTPAEAFHHHSSTAAEGLLRGQAARIRAEADYNLQAAEAEILREHAQSLSYDNDLKHSATGLARKQLVDSYRDYKRSRKLARRQQGEELREERDQQLAREYQLSAFEFNQVTGSVYWPAALAGPRYAEQRRRVELLLGQVVYQGNADNPLLREQLSLATNDFRRQLREDYQRDNAKEHRLAKQEFSAAHRFLRGLAYATLTLDREGPTHAPLGENYLARH